MSCDITYLKCVVIYYSLFYEHCFRNVIRLTEVLITRPKFVSYILKLKIKWHVRSCISYCLHVFIHYWDHRLHKISRRHRYLKAFMHRCYSVRRSIQFTVESSKTLFQIDCRLKEELLYRANKVKTESLRPSRTKSVYRQHISILPSTYSVNNAKYIFC